MTKKKKKNVSIICILRFYYLYVIYVYYRYIVRVDACVFAPFENIYFQMYIYTHNNCTLILCHVSMAGRITNILQDPRHDSVANPQGASLRTTPLQYYLQYTPCASMAFNGWKIMERHCVRIVSIYAVILYVLYIYIQVIYIVLYIYIYTYFIHCIYYNTSYTIQ